MTTTTEKLARYECAQEILGMLIALRSSCINQERKAEKPDLVRIRQWESEIDTFFGMDLDLCFNNAEGIEQVISKYGPEVRAGLGSQGERDGKNC